MMKKEPAVRQGSRRALLGLLAAALGAGSTACSEGRLRLTAVEPSAGSARGGEVVALGGEGLEQGCAVLFGTTPAASVTWQSEQLLEVVTPGHLAGAVDVAVQCSESATLPGGYSFLPLDLELVQAAAHYLPDLSALTLDDAAVADLDGDGDTDVLVAVRGEPSRRLVNSGNGAFVDDTPPPEGLLPTDPIATWVHSTRRLLVGDLDGDETPDALLCNRWGQPSAIYLNDGLGRFQPATGALPEVSDECRAAALADLDGDGDDDLVVVGKGKIGRGRSYLRVYLRTDDGGSPAFEPAPGLELLATDVEGEPVGQVQTAPAEVAGEHVITQEQAHSGAGSGRGSYDFSAAPGTVAFVHAVPELSSPPEAVELALRGGGSGLTAAVRLTDAGGEQYSYDLGALDAAGWQVVVAEDPASWAAAGGDGNGVIDLPLASVAVVVADAAGGGQGEIFVDDLRLRVPRTGLVIVEDFERRDFELSWADTPAAVAAGDLDGDGAADLVLTSAHGSSAETLRLVLNDTAEGGALKLRQGVSSVFAATGERIAWALLQDFDADADADVLAIAADGQDRLLVNDGRAHFFDDTAALLPVDAAQGQYATAADLDLDGQADLLITNTGAANRIYRSRGPGGYTDATPAMPIHTSTTVRLLPLDADGDGDLDLIELNQQGEPSLLFVSVEPDDALR